MRRPSKKREPLAGGIYWTSPGVDAPWLRPPLGAMTVEEFVAWMRHNRELKAAGKPAPSEWQEWLRLLRAKRD